MQQEIPRATATTIETLPQAWKFTGEATPPYIRHLAYKKKGDRDAYTLATALFIGAGAAEGGWVVRRAYCRAKMYAHRSLWNRAHELPAMLSWKCGGH